MIPTTFPADFEIAIELVLKHEGGYSNHAADSGGATNMGITARSLADYNKRTGLDWTIPTLEKHQAKEFYFDEYWIPLRLSEFNGQGVKNAVLATALHRDDSNGNFLTIKTLQKCLGLTEDGWIGPKTLGAVQYADQKKLLSDFCNSVENTYKAIAAQWYAFRGGRWVRCDPGEPGAKQKNQVFLKGWLKRINSFRVA